MVNRYILLLAGLIFGVCVMAQTPFRPVLHTGDTIYLSRDLLPQPIDFSDSGPDLYWDMSRLLSSFVHQSIVRPDGNGNFILTGPDDVERYFSEKPDGLYISKLGLPNAAGSRTMVRIDPPMPFAKGLRLDERWEYQGILSMTLPQSNREVRLSLNVRAEADAFGELYSPFYRYDVVREQRDIDIALAPGGAMVNPSDLGLPVGFNAGRVFVFQSAIHPMPVAIVQTDAMNQAKHVEYLSHPLAGTVLQQVPRRPDVFIYPNPSFGNVRFDFLNLPTGYYDLEIYNILGSKVRSDRFYVNGTKTAPMDLSRLKKGTYIYRLVDSQKNTIRSKRFVIITP